MILLRGLGLGILLICHYIIWNSTKTWQEFLYYVFFMNLFGALMGIPSGVIIGRRIKKIHKEEERKSFLKKLSNRQ